MFAPARHPEPDDLHAFANGDADVDIERHLDVCPECAEVVAGLVHAFGSGASIGDTETTLARPQISVGSKLERFHILDEVGRGAMGVVFAAYDPDLDRRVALKVLADTGSDVRFLREAQAMARLSHPNVIPVHEARVVDGRLYISMEFVEGSTLREWMGDRPRGWREVLDVFGQIARGLAAAHAAGLVHRDIKPDNVLIGRDGRARVTDFGLARPAGLGHAASGPEGPTIDALATEVTQAGTLVGTPAYMSPEQWRGELASAAADQFSFCVALFEALYSVRPFAGERMGTVRANVLAGRRQEPSVDRGVPRRVRIAVLRGLAPRPEERFASMDALARELARVGRAHVRRRQAALLMGALAIGGASTFAIGAVSDPACSGADERLAGIWDPARRTEVRASLLAVDRPFADATWQRVQRILDEYRDGWIAGYVDACEATNFRRTQSDALLDSRMRCLDGRRQRMSALVDLLADADEEVLRNASNAADALPPLSTCADAELMARQVAPPDDAQALARVETLRSELARVETLRLGGKYADGLAAAKLVRAEAEEVGYRPLLAEVLVAMGSLLERTGEYRQAEEALERAAWLGRATGHDEAVRDAAIGLVNATRGTDGTSERALRWAKLAWAEIERSPSDRAKSHLLVHEGNALREVSRNEEALAKLREAVELRTAELGEDHPQTALVLADLGKAQQQVGDFEGSMASNERALEILRDALGPDHPLVGFAMSSLAFTKAEMHEFAESIAWLEKTQVNLSRSLGETHPEVGRTLSNLGGMLAGAGRPEESLAALRRAVEIAEARMGGDHPDVATPLLGLAQTLLEMGRYREAVGPAERALGIVEATREAGADVGPRVHSSALSVLSNTYVGLGRNDDAVEAARAMVVVEREAFGEQHATVAAATFNLGSILGMAGRFDECRDALESALPLIKETMGPEDPYVGLTLTNLGVVYRELGRWDDAVAAGTQALAVIGKQGDPRPRRVAANELTIGAAKLGAGDAAEAITWLEQANARYDQQLGMDPERIGEARFALARALRTAGRDGKRARALAHKARTAYEAVEHPSAAATIQEIEAWLRKVKS